MTDTDLDDIPPWQWKAAAQKVATVRIPNERYAACPEELRAELTAAATAWHHDRSISQFGWHDGVNEITMWGPSPVVDRMVAAAMRIVEWTP